MVHIIPTRGHYLLTTRGPLCMPRMRVQFSLLLVTYIPTTEDSTCPVLLLLYFHCYIVNKIYFFVFFVTKGGRSAAGFSPHWPYLLFIIVQGVEGYKPHPRY